ncbi:MAG: histidine triad nucleotide-binding protein [Candidatus Yanofskybacteria bacterium CG10_big_fil_rev_8_21_14_0_10_36_16]|uniref:Histidine triad nucleotide-binding protein n=1 Tax=Candidatus Yanofskybacteria bacterium CG10_big_fil_rev_8_21_14_0_10_36_16 TaxID=1975096 RepID=A0A2J0QAV7_9BACT|nr:MAG: histidine triad nucleotide-binding protein [Candidatus Yanofskybacteria bacterium CG10_big_fil_rev_8_21_14_0_10_36_16]
MSDIFCKIISGEVNAEKIDEGENWIAIHDIHPVAPVHALIIPKKHGPLRDYENEEDGKLMGRLILAANRVATKLGLDKDGYRLIINYGEDSQAHVLDHLHIHLLGGKKLGSKIIQN